MKIIAIPTSQSQLAEHFGQCDFFTTLKIEDNKITEQSKIMPPQHQPNSFPAFLVENKVSDVLACGIGQLAINFLKENNVQVVSGLKIKTIEQIIEDLINNNLDIHINYCDH